MDWHQLWEIASTPDNVPIVALIPLLIFFSYLAVKQGRANDQLIGELETSPALAKTHHRKTWPFKPAFPVAHRIFGRHYSDHRSDGVVNYAERTSRGAIQS